MERDLKHRAAFDKQGETYVKLLSERDDAVGREARAYLYEKQIEREKEAAKLRDAREVETLKLAREANRIARASMYTAVAAAILSAVVGASVGFVLGK